MAAFQQGTIHIKEKVSTQANADPGWLRIYAKTDGNVYRKNEGGVEYRLIGSTEVADISAGLNSKINQALIPNAFGDIIIGNDPGGDERLRVGGSIRSYGIACISSIEETPTVDWAGLYIIGGEGYLTVRNATNTNSLPLNIWTSQVKIGTYEYLNQGTLSVVENSLAPSIFEVASDGPLRLKAGGLHAVEIDFQDQSVKIGSAPYGDELLRVGSGIRLKGGNDDLRIVQSIDNTFDVQVRLGATTDGGTLKLQPSSGSTSIGSSGGYVGFHGATSIAKPTITGSRGGNAALESLLTQLANYGLITNSTTA